MATVAELVSSLDSKYPETWTLYRTAIGPWLVKLGVKWNAPTVSAETIEDVLKAADEFVHCPTIPRRPRIVDRSQFACVKTGSKWELRYHNQFYAGHIATKTRANDFADRLAKQASDAIELWDHTHAHLVATGVEGKDFRYEH